MINLYNAGQKIRTDDRDLLDAIFLRRNAGWKPEDLGYPAGDYILVDLLRLIN